MSRSSRVVIAAPQGISRLCCSATSRTILSPFLSWSPQPSLQSQSRAASSGSSRWKQRQGNDAYTRDAKVQGLKSRAAFKLLEMDSKYKLFRSGQTVVDLGYAPGSWSQVALDRTKPHSRVIGIDLIPAQPPKGVSTFQGDFLSPVVQHMVKNLITESHRRQPPVQETSSDEDDDGLGEVIDRPSYIEMERQLSHASEELKEGNATRKSSRLVDVSNAVDMSAPWEQTTGFSVNTLSNPYHRLMNTSGMAFRDHAGSMDLCAAALSFANDTLKAGGHFVCKFYQGSEDKALELRLKKLFWKVHREKPESSRSESKEAYFVALKRKHNVTLED
ncbi:ftsJ-like methyltransferase domain-containing protein [Sarocladium implicatum]|nr:ftsJ-like methyltransferase domain-containing protein [Sarocladium implicatum]